MNRKSLIAVAAIILLLLGIVILFQNKPLQNSGKAPTAQSTSPPATQNTLQAKPTLISPQPNEKVLSPLIVRGEVPNGWMFEGVFPVTLLDSNRKVIIRSQARETVGGSWTLGKEVEFRSILIFKTTAKSGFLVLEKDNPSGLPEHAGYFEIPVIF